MSAASSSSAAARPAKKQRRAPRAAPDAPAELPLGRFLASPDKKLRDGAVRSLAAFLSQRAAAEPISREDMAKLWKGIFYCFWMSDKPLVQQALAQELADLVLLVPRAAAPSSSSSSSASAAPACQAALGFLEGFWDAIVREWSGLDKWRMDKFYLLVRRFTNAGFRLVVREQWDAAAVAELARIMRKQGGPMCPNDVKVPDSITYHLADVYLDELERAIASQEADGEAPPTPLLELLQPWVVTVASAHSGPMYTRIMDNVLHPLLRDLLVDEPSADEDAAEAAAELAYPRLLATAAAPPASELGDDEYDEAARRRGRRAQLRLALFRRLFAEASRPEALQARRHNLYKLWEAERARMDDDDAEESE